MTEEKKYDPKSIEPKWQQHWLNQKLFAADDESEKERRYVLVEFPYPSGDGLHVGHVKNYTATDAYARYLRMKGYNVLHPTGWDAFGLPTENSAIKTGVHPAELTKRNTDRFREQMQMMGLSYDWDREIDTTDPGYYKWTQWIFLKLFKRGLAYEDTIPINWCPSCKTGLANEEVIDGHCERCGHQVQQKPIRQWMLKITEYADQLLSGLDQLEWPEHIKEIQRNWIGRSEGVNFIERVKGSDIEFKVYDSIPQTFMAQTFTMIAPDHAQLPELVRGTEHEQPVMEFVERVKQKKQAGKFDIETDLEGIFTGRYIEDPFGTGDLPLWVSSFVLADYGSGVVNASAHDERDFAFAKKYDLPLRTVMAPADQTEAARVRNLEYCYTKDVEGILEQPTEFAGRKWGEVREDIIDYIVEKGLGERAINYKLRDWVFSRQRYWGEPIPLVHCEQCGIVPVPEEELPLTLPEVESYQPTGTGESPLAAVEEWVNTSCPTCDGPAKRETNTMPQWAGSSWYWVRFADPENDQALVSSEAVERWLPLDVYVGGAEHAVLHLLYGRFWNMVLHDEGAVNTAEPFPRRHIVGVVLGADNQKMSKSRGNVVNPDDEVAKYGADTVRTFALFMGPFEGSAAWTTEGIAGCERFVKRVWNYFQKSETHPPTGGPKLETEDVDLAVQKTIKRVTESIEQFKFNTGVAALMELLNLLEDQEGVSQQVLETYVKLLSPYAPHVAEELWQQLGHEESVLLASWPEVDEAVLKQAMITVPVQINGKVRGTVSVAAGTPEDQVVSAAQALPNVAKHLDGKAVKKTIFVPDKLLSFVV